MSYFPEPHTRSKNKIKVELDQYNYKAKSDLKNATAILNQKLRICYKKTDLANLKSGVDKLDIDELINVPSCLISLKKAVDKLDVGKLETTPEVDYRTTWVTFKPKLKK